MKILIVDDNPMNRQIAREMLAMAGVETVEAEDGAQALARLDASDFDCVLMDLRMPAMDGLEATVRMRARTDSRAEVPIVMVTADGGGHVRSTCCAAGADEVVFKPLSMDALFDAIGRAAVARGKA